MSNQYDSKSEYSFLQRLKNDFFLFFKQLSLNISSWWNSLFNKKKPEAIVVAEPVNAVPEPKIQLLFGAASVGLIPAMQQVAKLIPESPRVDFVFNTATLGTYSLAKHGFTQLKNTRIPNFFTGLSLFTAPKAQITAPKAQITEPTELPAVTVEKKATQLVKLSDRGMFFRNIIGVSAAFLAISTIASARRQ